MFHVPEDARICDGDTQWPPFLWSNRGNGNNGAFILPAVRTTGWQLFVIASDGGLDGSGRWEHVSAHARRGTVTRTPTWEEMCCIKRLFWDAEDVVVQFHPRESEYVNNHPHTLHLWRPVDVSIPTPPPLMVGVR